MKNRAFVTKVAALMLIAAFAVIQLSACAFFQPKINGVNIGKYTIVYDFDGSDYAKRAAEYLQESIKEATGAKLDIITDNDAPAEHEIVVGETSRPISAALDAECEGFEFSILADENHIALEGDYFIIAAAAYFFMETYVKADGGADVPKSASVHEPIVKEAKNFILLIGDGMGESQTKLFDVYDVPSDGNTAYSDGEDFFYGYLFPNIGYARTESLDGVTDSAAAGTALASGYKTHNGYVGKDENGNDVKLLPELAASLGMASAVMSTESKTGATPASFSAHAPNRDNDSLIIEAQQKLTQSHGTIIDCGYDYYTLNQLSIVERHITDTLGEVSADEDGFFLMYEEAHIDKRCHANDADGTFLALMRFNQAIGRFMEFAFYNPDTFVLITADHETGGLSLTAGEAAYSTTEHTASNVPVFAYGKAAGVFDGATVENTQIAKTIASLMGVSDFGKSGEFESLIK